MASATLASDDFEKNGTDLHSRSSAFLSACSVRGTSSPALTATQPSTARSHQFPSPQSTPHGSPSEQSVALSETVDALSVDIEAMQVNFKAVSQKILTIKKVLGRMNDIVAKDDSILEPPLNNKVKQRTSMEGQAVARDNSPPLGHDQQRRSVRIDEVESITVPLPLAGRWNSCDRERTLGHMKSFGHHVAKPRQLRWHSRWQDLFDSNEQEATIDRKSAGNRAASNLLHRAATGILHVSKSDRCMIHPHGRFRVTWDVMGLLLVLYDAITLPVYVAWDTDLGNAGIVLLVCGICFWSIDIALGFCTGYFLEATLDFSRKAVALHYLRTWLLADIFLVCLDLLMVIMPSVSNSAGTDGSSLKTLRVIRLLRLSRGLRLLKMSKLAQTLEQFFQTTGGNFFSLVLSISKTLACIYLIAHLAACSWYFIGSLDTFAHSWIDLIDNFERDPIINQYIRSCYWVLGHLCAAPVDPTIYPTNPLERAFTLFCITSSLLVIGISVSKMSGTVAALNRANAEAHDTKRKLQGFLHSNNFPRNLSGRVIRHALKVHRKKIEMTLDPFVLNLLSSALVFDINAWQRGKHMQQHPLFVLLKEIHPEVVLEVYSACVPRIYADGDIVYKVGTISEALYITVGGVYKLHHFPDLSESYIVNTYDTTEFFCEVSLFVQTHQRSTLKALTFADSLSLHSADFVQCVRLVPGCIGSIYRYARYYLSKLVEVDPQPPEAEPVVLNEGVIAVQDVMPIRLAEEACAVVREEHLPELSELSIPNVADGMIRETLAYIMEQDISTTEIVQQLEMVFPEIRSDTGFYAQISEEQERQRSIGAMLGLILLVKNSYHDFVRCQKDESRMTKELWLDWQLFINWTDTTLEILHALLVFLCLRGLGKIKAVLRMVPSRWRSPENAVLYLMNGALHSVPSASHLEDDTFKLVKEVFQTLRRFNLAQLMQGENTPAQVQGLKNSILERGECFLKFYLSALVGVMCGLTGAVTLDGCLFMDEINAKNVLLCIQCLRQIEKSQPHAVYWSYIVKRGLCLGLPVSTLEELTIVRLACLMRASTADCVELREEWATLGPYDKNILVQHFLADGIQEKAFMLSFLPIYLVNAKNNRVVGLHRGLLVLIDLIELLHADGMVNHVCAKKMVIANISDVASFTNEVVNSMAFDSLAEYSTLVLMDSEVRVSVVAKHWHASSHDTWKPDATLEIAHVVKRMSRTTRSVEDFVGQVFERISSGEDMDHNLESNAEDAPVQLWQPGINVSLPADKDSDVGQKTNHYV